MKVERMFESLKVKGSIILGNKPLVFWVPHVHHHNLENRNFMLIILIFSKQSPRKGQRRLQSRSTDSAKVITPGSQGLDQLLPPLRAFLSLLSQCFWLLPLNLHRLLFIHLFFLVFPWLLPHLSFPCSITHKTWVPC